MKPRTMQALQLTLTSPSVSPKLVAATLPIPQLKPGHALVRIHYTAIQPSDRMNAQGHFPSTTFPRVPGRDYSGIVVDTADDTTEAKSWIGKYVYGTSGPSLGFDSDGTHAQYCLVSLNALVEKPSSLSLRQAATVGVPFTTASLCMRRAQVKPDDIVLVLGANGAVGSAVTQMARAIGCKKVLTAARREDSVPDILLASDISSEALEQSISALTHGKGVDVIIDTVGDLALMSGLVECLSMFGRYAWIAAPRGNVDKRLQFDIFQAYRKGLSLLGCNSVACPVETTAEYLRSLHAWIEGGNLEARSEGDFEKVTLDSAIEFGYGKSGKVVIDMS